MHLYVSIYLCVGSFGDFSGEGLNTCIWLFYVHLIVCKAYLWQYKGNGHCQGGGRGCWQLSGACMMNTRKLWRMVSISSKIPKMGTSSLLKNLPFKMGEDFEALSHTPPFKPRLGSVRMMVIAGGGGWVILTIFWCLHDEHHKIVKMGLYFKQNSWKWVPLSEKSTL